MVETKIGSELYLYIYTWDAAKENTIGLSLQSHKNKNKKDLPKKCYI